MSRRPRLALLPGEPLRERMGGIGVRYLELVGRLAEQGVEPVLLQPGEPGIEPHGVPGDVEVRPARPGALAAAVADCDAVLAQGQPANDLLLEVRDRPVAIDLYDPFLVENLGYLEELGLDPWRNDHATWVLQLSRGDFFLCSCEEQRLYYLGFLTALGRVNPERIAADPDLRTLVDAVPFGVTGRLPPHRPVLAPRRDGEVRLLFGGLYDWYDPAPVLEALERYGDPAWTVVFVRSPNPESTPQARFREVEKWAAASARRARLHLVDWIPAERRFDLLRDVDLMVATHRPGLETRLSLRTRFLEALAADLPVVATEGGAIAGLLRRHGAGGVVPAGDAAAVAAAIRSGLARDPEEAAGRRALVADFGWDRVLEPLVRFAHAGRIDPTKERFAFRPETRAPAEPAIRRFGRRLRRALGSRR